MLHQLQQTGRGGAPLEAGEGRGVRAGGGLGEWRKVCLERKKGQDRSWKEQKCACVCTCVCVCARACVHACASKQGAAGTCWSWGEGGGNRRRESLTAPQRGGAAGGQARVALRVPSCAQGSQAGATPPLPGQEGGGSGEVTPPRGPSRIRPGTAPLCPVCPAHASRGGLGSSPQVPFPRAGDIGLRPHRAPCCPNRILLISSFLGTEMSAFL